MVKPKVMITGYDIPDIATEILREYFEIVHIMMKPTPDKAELVDKIQGVDAVIWTLRSKLDKDMLDAAGPQLRVISAFSAGTDFIDLKDMERRGISLYNVRDVNDSVADIAVLLVLAASRRLEEGRRHILNGTWTAALQWMLGPAIQCSTVGIVGLGGIGLACMERLKGFKVGKFLYCGPKEKKEGNKLGAIFVSFEELLKESDFVIITCPWTSQTEKMFNKKAFDMMRTTSVLVNVARGPIVNHDDLVEALETKKIFAAGLDVTVPEPLPVDHKLISLPNCVLTPHLGNATIRDRSEMAKRCAINLLRAYNIKSKYDTE